MENKSKTLASALLRERAVKFGDFILTSGRHSDYYVDIKDACAEPMILHLIVEILKEKIVEKKVAGVELGAVPILVGVSYALNIPYVIKRKEIKHGTGRLNIGVINSDEPIDVIEDVVTTGNSSLECVKYLRENGALVSRVFCVVDREEGGRELLQTNGVELIPILTISDLRSR